MTPRRPHRSSSSQKGFSLLELMVTTAVIGLVVAVSYPSFNQSIRKARSKAYLEEVSLLLVQAKQEAVRRAVPVVVQPDPATVSLFAYANVDGDPSITYQPDESKTYRTVDYEVFRHTAESLAKIRFESPSSSNGNGGGNGRGRSGNSGNGNNGNGSTAGPVDGLTPVSSGQNAIVFEPNGSVRDAGALRITDQWGNYFEIRVGPAATGRISVLKYNEAPHWGDAAGYFPRGTDPSSGKPYWSWSTKDSG